MEFREVKSKTQQEIVSEWDQLAPIRYQQLVSRQDFTFWHVLAPAVLSLMRLTKADSILDAGCGVGVLSGMLAEQHKSVVAIDPSARSVEIGLKHFDGPRFFVSTLEDYAAQSAPLVSVIVANMVLMDVLDLEAFLGAAFSVLRPNGALIFTITHPFFWPNYYGYASEPWFRYEREAIVESPFRISAQQDCRLNSTHVHRPLSAYMNTLFRSGFVTEVLQEPMPSVHAARAYPKPWAAPRYLAGLARREGSKTLSRARRASFLSS